MAADDFSDEAAELDTDPGAATSSTDDDGDDEAQGPSYNGRCHGGPWDTSDVEARFPKGFLLIHKPEHAVWIYDRKDDGDFYVRSATPSVLDDAGRWKAADGVDYDIRVLDPAAVKPSTAVAS